MSDNVMAEKLPLPVQMNAVMAKVNGAAVPVQSVGQQQINFLLPLDVRDVSSVVVSYAGNESAPARLMSNQFPGDAAPGILTLSAEGQGAVLIGGTGFIARATGEESRPASRGGARLLRVMVSHRRVYTF